MVSTARTAVARSPVQKGEMKDRGVVVEGTMSQSCEPAGALTVERVVEVEGKSNR